MTNDAILNARSAIWKEFKAFDNSFKVKKPTLCSILQSIDNDTSIEDSIILHNYNLWYNLAMLTAQKKSASLANYLKSVQYQISEELAYYQATYSTVYKVDDSFKDWWFSKPHDKDEDFHYSWFESGSPVLLEYTGVVYIFERDSKEFSIRILNDYERSAFLNYEYSSALNSSWNECKITCNNTSCPHYKSSVGHIYKDGTREVICSLSDLQKCGQCEVAGLVHPFIVEELFNGIAYTMENRSSVSSESSGRNDYEHLPKPERVDDIIVYFGGVVEHKPLPFLKVSDTKSEKVFPDSHASPREHYRRGSTRKAYTRSGGTKVRATTVKGTVVNKGHTKVNYTLKERK